MLFHIVTEFKPAFLLQIERTEEKTQKHFIQAGLQVYNAICDDQPAV